MKPIFEQEKWFFYNQTGIQLPENCWRDGSKIYLNGDKETLIINFKVENGKVIIKKNNIEQITSTVRNKSYEDEIKENRKRLKELENESIKNTIKYIRENPNHELRLSHSGGKDSDVIYHIFKKVKRIYKKKYGEDLKYTIDFFNTSNDTPQTYRRIKRIQKEDNLLIHNPEVGWYQWLEKEKNYFLPTIFVRNCCSTYKEGKLKDILNKDRNYITLLGARKHESIKRKDYDWDLNKAWAISNPGKKMNMPENWKRFLPAVEFTDKEVWLYILKEKLEINEQYYMGFNRCGCLLCPYASDYTDLLIKHFYNSYWKRWMNIVSLNYDTWGVEKRLKWSKEEYGEFGKWKNGISKEGELIGKKATPERVKDLAKLKGISEEMSLKYFNKKCSCGKKLNSDEIAMYLKLHGRYEGFEDDRVYLCRGCLCKDQGINKDKYNDMVLTFRNGGCELF